MKFALITTPPSVVSGIGDYTRHLLAELSRHAEIELFVEHGREGEKLLGRKMLSVRTLDPRAFDQIVYQLGNEIAHAFMVPMLRRLGGTVVLHDWILFDLALATHPALARGGAKGLALALREGGFREARVYFENGLARRRQARAAPLPVDPRHLEGTLLDGWHLPETAGRWTSDLARVRLFGETNRSLRVSLTCEPGRSVELRCRERSSRAQVTAANREQQLEIELVGSTDPVVSIAVRPLSLSDEQRRNGDTRRLGAFIREISVRDARGERTLDLRAEAARPAAPMGLWSDRFRLSLNRSVVNSADAFLVHSQHVGELISRARGGSAPSALVGHGAQPRWRDGDRRETRKRLNLPDQWQAGVLLTSFGSVQAHKRIEPLLRAFHGARASRPDLRLALIGAEDSESLDVAGLLRALGLEGSVRLTGRVEESEAWDWIHAGDFAVQLRGPSTGGTSGGVFQSLALGRAVIASDLAEQRELPDSCVLRVAPGADEVQQLSRLFLDLAGDVERRAKLEAAARDFVAGECSWSTVAARYAENLARFPRPRAARAER